MQPQSAQLIRFFPGGFALAFLGLFALAPSAHAQTATTEAGVVFAGPICCQVMSFNSSDSMLTRQVDVGLPDEFGIALEDDDSVEMFRMDSERCTFGNDRSLIGPTVVSRAARNTRPNISPPLLV